MTTFIQARNYTAGRIKPIRLIVMHDMETLQRDGTALAVARWFGGASAPQASCHYCVDDRMVIQCVKDADTAWGAPGANSDGLQIELAGMASQTGVTWEDPYSRQELALAAKLCAALAKKYAIPVVHLTPAQVAGGRQKGLCGHIDVTRAFDTVGGHTDPGPDFPWDVYLTMVKVELDALNGHVWKRSAIAAAAATLGVSVAVLGYVTQTSDPTPAPKPTVTVVPRTAAPTTAPVKPTTSKTKPTTKPTSVPTGVPRVTVTVTVTPTTITATKKPSAVVYVIVRAGDSLYAYALKYHTTTKAIETLNKLTSTTLHVGQRVRVK